MKFISVLMAIILVFGCCSACTRKEEVKTMEFKDLLRERILEVLDSWEAKDQYAIMFLIYPNESFEYGGYSNIPKFSMLYKCESDIGHNPAPALPFFIASSKDEERWSAAFWDCDEEEAIIDYGRPNPMADALIRWYKDTGVKDIGTEDRDQMYDIFRRYIGKGPKGLTELLKLASEIAAQLQDEGMIEAKFGKKIPILLADLEFTWYMVKATREANPNGEADAYIEACLRNRWVSKSQIQ